MRGAECSIDHKMLRMKLVVGATQKSFCRPRSGPRVPRYNMAKLQQKGVDDGGSAFCRLLCEKQRESTQSADGLAEKSVEDQWLVVKSALRESAKSALGLEVKKCPD